MTYFHTGIRTIIGAKSFHCPVRDGKEWDQLAMVIRHNWMMKRLGDFFPKRSTEFIESQISFNLEYGAAYCRPRYFECVSLGITNL